MFGTEKLTQRQEEIVARVIDFQHRHGYTPTVREIAAATGIASSTVHEHLANLEKLGVLHRPSGKKRALRLVEEPSHSTLPLLGQIAAGVPLLAEEQIEDYVEVPSMLRRGGVEFLLRARGESMIDAGILDGDLLVIQRCDAAENGEIVAALVGDDESAEEATVKYLFREAGRVRLQPANSLFEPLYPQWLRVIGRVVAQLRSY